MIVAIAPGGIQELGNLVAEAAEGLPECGHGPLGSDAYPGCRPPPSGHRSAATQGAHSGKLRRPAARLLP
jgi:hypothetical protein